ncbi:uncharacterized protein LOC132739959 isoform X2 [Ruditapes philippinarum]|uniref:uncharacterized protein LOC132739959 isoform X2 n=1 Tax=Ruditapes philippinarum TaxID=129788 RepID=UPI00295C019C|nr:uncharacterized protein LOC132739959 isoform X2 [Ruditapes philippinarum]
MRCSITETDVDRIYLIQIRRLKSTTHSGSDPNDWQTLALMEVGRNENPTLTDDITAVAASKDYVAGGSWDSTTLANTYLTLSMSMEKMVCDDARYYRCELSYKSTTSGTIANVYRNVTFSAYVEGMSPSNMAIADVGDELHLTCTANIGSLPGAPIRWHRTSETSKNDDFIGYQPPEYTYDKGIAISDSQCGYTRVASIRYYTTAADANRENNLAFECFVTVSGDPYGLSYTSENNPKFYTAVTKPDNGNTVSNIGTTGTDVSLAIFMGTVIFALVFAVLSGVVFTLRCLIRTKTGHTTQDQHQHIQIQETRISDVAISTNTYEQLQNRGDTEGRMTYDSLNVSSSGSPISSSQYENLTH